MASQQDSKKQRIVTDSSGIALFMVLGAISMLTVLVAEFTYVTQVNQTIAFGALDEAKAHYLAKSGLKLSLLRLKAYQQVKALVGNMGGKGGVPGIGKGMIEKIWNFPFFYPIPTNIPGLSGSDKDSIDKFQKDSGLDGKFSAIIESESARFNLNFIVPGYASVTPLASPSPTAPPPFPFPGSTPTPTPTAQPSPAPTFSPEEARASLATLINTILNNKFESDPDFAASYRDLRLEDLVDNIAAWADRTYERRTTSNRDKIPMKRGPFYSMTELHYLANIDDEIYNLLTPSLTVSPTGGLNVNTITEHTLKALIPLMTKEEVTEFFKYRDSEENDNYFKDADAFFNYLKGNVSVFRDQYLMDQFKNDLQKRNITIVTEELYFKITVQAKVNSATRTIEAHVTLGTPDPMAALGIIGRPGTPGTPPISGPGPAAPGAPGGSGSESGIKITSMKIF